jgi:hypothetical protein
MLPCYCHRCVVCLGVVPTCAVQLADSYATCRWKIFSPFPRIFKSAFLQRIKQQPKLAQVFGCCFVDSCFLSCGLTQMYVRGQSQMFLSLWMLTCRPWHDRLKSMGERHLSRWVNQSWKHLHDCTMSVLCGCCWLPPLVSARTSCCCRCAANAGPSPNCEKRCDWNVNYVIPRC